MCFSIPKKIIKVEGRFAQTEDGKMIQLGKLKVAAGDYVRVYGNMAVEKIDKNNALMIRSMIKPRRL